MNATEKKMKRKARLFILLVIAATFFQHCTSNLREEEEADDRERTMKTNDLSIHVAGAMRNVMHKGELNGVIAVDTIAEKEHLYGLGPIEGLSGEILIEDGKGFTASLQADSSLLVKSTFDIKAPFFVYGHVASWDTLRISDSVVSMEEFESFIDSTSEEIQRPFCFRVTGDVRTAAIHVVALPAGTKVNAPEDVFKHQKRFDILNQSVRITGFFSTEHQGIFTHHDSFIHLHLITADNQQMGHLDEMTLQPGGLLLLPRQSN